MYHRTPFWTLASLKIMTMCFINARALDTMSQDWNPDTYQWTDLLEVPEVQNQGEFIQSDLSGSTDSTLQNSGHTGLEDPDLFDWMDPSALTSDFDNTLALDTDSIAIGCTSDSSPPRISKRKKKQKEKQVCPATSTSPSTSGVEELDCTPESQICPIGKTALCCNGEKEAWERWYGHSVGGCIKYSERDNCRLPVCQTFLTLFCCDFLGMAYMDPEAGFGCTYNFL